MRRSDAPWMKFAVPSVLRSSVAFLEKAVPKDAKSAACVKKSVLFEQSEFADFSKLPIWQGFWKRGLDFLVTWYYLSVIFNRANG